MKHTTIIAALALAVAPTQAATIINPSFEVDVVANGSHSFATPNGAQGF